MIETFEELTIGDRFEIIVAGGEIIAGRLLEIFPLPSRILVDFGGGCIVHRADFFGAWPIGSTPDPEDVRIRIALSTREENEQ